MPISQPTLVLAFALSFGVASAAAVAGGAFIKARIPRVRHIGACIAGTISSGACLPNSIYASTSRRACRLASTGSRLCRQRANSTRYVCRRMHAAHCCRACRRADISPRDIAQAGTELLLKMIVAAGGDDVIVSGNGVSVNGCALPHSRQFAVDVAGRKLSRWPQGRYRLRSDQLWLYAANDQSWDSRYWGPAAAADVTAGAVPLFTAPRSTSGEPGCGVRTPPDRILRRIDGLSVPTPQTVRDRSASRRL